MYKTVLITVPSSKEHDIMRNFCCLVGIRLPINADLTVQVRRIFKLFPAVYKNEHTFYNTVYRRIVKMRLVDNVFSPEFEQEVLCDTAEIVCALNPGMKMRRAVKMVWDECRHGYKNFESFYNSYLERRNHK